MGVTVMSRSGPRGFPTSDKLPLKFEILSFSPYSRYTHTTTPTPFVKDLATARTGGPGTCDYSIKSLGNGSS